MIDRQPRQLAIEAPIRARTDDDHRHKVFPESLVNARMVVMEVMFFIV
jgi:hypothetical protein